jgi:SAM-dependent methyltransferase
VFLSFLPGLETASHPLEAWPQVDSTTPWLGRLASLCYTAAMLEAMDRAAPFFDADYAGYAEDLPLVQAYAQRTGSPLLELGCGTGRLLLPLALAGYDVTGVELSPEMLRIARAKAEAAGIAGRVTLVQGDFSDAPLPRSYRLALVMMNTFLHLTTQAEQVRALRHWREHLLPGGLLLIDVFNPDVAQLAGLDGRVEWDKTWTDPRTGASVMKFLTRTVDLAEQVIHVNLVYDEIAADGCVARTLVPFEQRYLWRFEAELLLDRAGFALEAVYGDRALGPFDGSSDTMILVARRRGR